MKETIEFIKTLWSNKRTKSLAILIIYLIFFIFAFTFIGSGTKKNIKPIDESKKELDQNEKFDLANVTNYFAEIIGNETFTYDSVSNTIIYNETSYDLESKPEVLSNYDLTIFKPSNISKLLENSILESTNHIENTKTYLIKISDFEKIVYEKDIINEENIKITTYLDNSKIIVDLSNYYDYVVNIELRD